ncbi:MAG: 4Fe-4S dicluster domain-containing protein [Proteobacteria bacterium]|nr:4Fe-4S dicluster domain-containing protein [Pseudomonadota bacterium]
MELNRIDHDRCTLCELCIDVCVRYNLRKSDDVIEVVSDMCNRCGHCKSVCPENAIAISGLEEGEFEPVPDKSDRPRPEQLMGFFRSRRSTRIYKKDAVERDKLEKIIEAGRFAPTGGNRQPLHYSVVEKPGMIDEVRNSTFEALVGNAEMIDVMMAEKEKKNEPLSVHDQAMKRYSQSWRFMSDLNRQGIDRLFYHAPALIVTHADLDVNPTPDVDAGLGAMQMALLAESMGLGTCYIGFLIGAAQSSPKLKDLLRIPERNKAVVSFVTGYPEVEYFRLVSRDPAKVDWI